MPANVSPSECAHAMTEVHNHPRDTSLIQEQARADAIARCETHAHASNVELGKAVVPSAALSTRPERAQAEQALRVLLRWAGEDPEREGLRDTPARVARAYEAFFSGYGVDPRKILACTFSEIDGYDEMVVLTNIRFESYCEHHMVPIIGRAHVAYLPNDRVVGVSKLARLVEAFAKRLQIQERMTAQIADTLNDVLQPKGVGVILEAAHQCISTRGIHKPGIEMMTSRMIGAFHTNPSVRREFLSIVSAPTAVNAAST